MRWAIEKDGKVYDLRIGSYEEGVSTAKKMKGTCRLFHHIKGTMAFIHDGEVFPRSFPAWKDNNAIYPSLLALEEDTTIYYSANYVSNGYVITPGRVQNCGKLNQYLDRIPPLEQLPAYAFNRYLDDSALFAPQEQADHAGVKHLVNHEPQQLLWVQTAFLQQVIDYDPFYNDNYSFYRYETDHVPALVVAGDKVIVAVIAGKRSEPGIYYVENLIELAKSWHTS